jgi:uncharacterized protein (TIGR02271 family)
MTTTEQLQRIGGWRGHNLMDESGSKIGRIEEIYADEDTGEPEWLAVKTGWFGSHVSFVPIQGATERDGDICTRWSKDQVKDAPHIDEDGHLSQQEEATLYRHYGVNYSDRRSDSGLPEGGRGRGGTGQVRGTETRAPGFADRNDVQGRTPSDSRLGNDLGHDTSGPETDTAMTRSEEQLRVGKTQEEMGQVRLRKWVETEHVQRDVPVARERARVEREPITDQNRDAAMRGAEISEEEHEMPLYEEKVTADTEVDPKERVRLDKDVVTENQSVDADLRKEHVEVDGDTDRIADRDHRR